MSKCPTQAIHRASSGKAPRWYWNPRTVSRRARASDRAGGVECGGEVAGVGGAIVTYGDGDDGEAAGDPSEKPPLEGVEGEADEGPPFSPSDPRPPGRAPP